MRKVFKLPPVQRRSTSRNSAASVAVRGDAASRLPGLLACLLLILSEGGLCGQPAAGQAPLKSAAERSGLSVKSQDYGKQKDKETPGRLAPPGRETGSREKF